MNFPLRHPRKWDMCGSRDIGLRSMDAMCGARDGGRALLMRERDGGHHGGKGMPAAGAITRDIGHRAIRSTGTISLMAMPTDITSITATR